jgi:hypothetical protein
MPSQVDDMDRKRRHAGLDPRQLHFVFYLEMTCPTQPTNSDGSADEMCEKVGSSGSAITRQ